MLGRWKRKGEKHRADKQQGDAEALAVDSLLRTPGSSGRPSEPTGRFAGNDNRAAEADPRGGMQSEDYRHADPREVVVEEGVAMSGPAGAPQQGESVEERRERDRG